MGKGMDISWVCKGWWWQLSEIFNLRRWNVFQSAVFQKFFYKIYKVASNWDTYIVMLSLVLRVFNLGFLLKGYFLSILVQKQ